MNPADAQLRTRIIAACADHAGSVLAQAGRPLTREVLHAASRLSRVKLAQALPVLIAAGYVAIERPERTSEDGVRGKVPDRFSLTPLGLAKYGDSHS